MDEALKKLEAYKEADRRSKMHLINEGLPPLGHRIVETATRYRAKKKKPIVDYTVEETSTFGLLDDYRKDKLQPAASSIWLHYNSRKLYWSNNPFCLSCKVG